MVGPTRRAGRPQSTNRVPPTPSCIQDWKLSLITKVGLALSLVCLLLCILTFLLVRPIQGSRTTVHLHLCICLFVGSTIFLAGIENEGGQVRPRPVESPTLA